MNLPDYRRAIHGRTYSQCWEPNAIEVGYRSIWVRMWRMTRHYWALEMFHRRFNVPRGRDF